MRSRILVLLGILAALAAACARSDAAWRRDLTSPDAYERALASLALCLQSPRAAAPALPVLLETIDRAEVGLEREAAHVLSLVGRYHVGLLLDELASDPFLTTDRRGAILNALVSAGAAAPAPVVRCLRGLGREHAADLGEVLFRIGEPAVPAILELVRSPDDVALQRLGISLLGRLGPRASAGRPVLREALDSPDDVVRRLAREALARIQHGGG